MDPLMTLPADSYALPNGSPTRLSASAHSLAGNVLWAVGHLPHSHNHSLFYFHGVKGGTLQWHKFATPERFAEQVQLELGVEGGLGVRMDHKLYLGTVESVPDARISWSTASHACQDFQLGRDRVCIRSRGSSNLSLVPCDLSSSSSSLSLPPSSLPIDCYCVSSNDDVIVLSALSVLVLTSPYTHWTQLQTAPAPRTFLPSLFAAKQPSFSRVCVSGNHFCASSKDGQSLSLLPMQPSPSWQHLSLGMEIRDLCSIGSPGQSLCLLLLDRHFSLFLASPESKRVRTRELPPSLLPDTEVLFSTIRSLSSLFEPPSQLHTLLAPSLSLSPLVSSPSQQDAFFTADPVEQQPMDVEISHPTHPSAHSSFHTANPSADLSNNQLIIASTSADLSNDQLINYPSTSADLSNNQLINYLSPSADLSNDQLIIASTSADLSDELIPTDSPEFSSHVLIPQSADAQSSQDFIIPQSADDLTDQLIRTPSPDESSQLLFSSPDLSQSADISAHQLVYTPSAEFVAPTHLTSDQSADSASHYLISTPPTSCADLTQSVLSTADPKLSIPPADSLFSSADRVAVRTSAERVSECMDAALSQTGSKRAKSSSQSPYKFHRVHSPILSDTGPSFSSHSTDTSLHLSSSFNETYVNRPAPRTSEQWRTDRRLLRERAAPCPLPATSFLAYLPDYSHFYSLLEHAESRGEYLDPVAETQELLLENFDFSFAAEEVNKLDRQYGTQPSPFIPISSFTPSTTDVSPSAPPTLNSPPSSPIENSSQFFQL